MCWKPLSKKLRPPAVWFCQTASGLVLPDTAKEKSQQGKVLAVGPDIEGEISVDDVVLYAKYAGTEVKIEGNAVLILSEADILALVK